MVIDPNPVNFGQVWLCQNRTITIRIGNTSGSSGNLNGSFPTVLTSNFIVVNGGGDFSILPGNWKIITLKFVPNTTGFQGTNASITHNANNYSNPYLLWLTGEGLPPILNINFSSSSITFPVTQNCQTSQTILTIQNNSNSTCTLSGTVYGNELVQPFSVIIGNGDFTLNPGATKDVTLKFSPVNIGNFSGSLKIWSDATNQSGYIYIPLYGVSENISSINWDYLVVSELTNKKVFLVNYQNNSFYEKKQIPYCNGLINFLSPSGAVVIGGFLYVTDQGTSMQNSKIYKINLLTENEVPFELYSYNLNISYPHDIKYYNGKLYILTQNVGGAGVNSIIIYDMLSQSPPVQIILPLNEFNENIGSPTRLVKINNKLYFSSLYNNQPTYNSYINYFLESDIINGNILPSNKLKRLYNITNTGSDLIVSHGYNKELIVWNFISGASAGLLRIYINDNLIDSKTVPNTIYPSYLMQSKSESNYLFLSNEYGNIFKVDKSNPTSQSILSTTGGVYVTNNSLTRQIGNIGNNQTTNYMLGESQVASITWHSNLDNLPTSVLVSYYHQSDPPGLLNGNFSNSFWEISSSSGSNFTYDITLYYDESILNNIFDENKIILAILNSNNQWDPLYGSVVNSTQNTVTYSGLTYFSKITLTDTASPLPVSMSYFTNLIRDNNVILKWGTSQEINNSGFDIERKIKDNTDWTKLGFVQGNGTTNEEKHYSFVDSNLISGAYDYRLKQLDYNGNSEYYFLNTVVLLGKGNKYSISQNYPNPSNPKSTINYELPIDTKISITLFDVLGREVMVLVNDFKKAGYYRVEFDGSNFASGIYLYRIKAGNFVVVKKLVLIK